MIKEDIINLLIDIIEEKKYSNIHLNYFFKVKNYSTKEKAFINNSINIVLKNLIYIDFLLFSTVKNVQKRKIKYLLKLSIAQIIFTEKDNKGIINEAVEIAKKINIHQGKFVKFALQKIINTYEEINKKLEEEKNYSILYSYPNYIVEKIKNDYGNEYVDVLKSYKERSYFSVRINKRKINNIEFEQILNKIETDILFQVEDVYYLSNNNILNTHLFSNGSIAIQDASSYIVAKNIMGNKEDIILDACAAPGGKTLAISQLFDVQKIVDIDIHPHKIELLKEMKEKFDINNLQIIEGDFTKIEFYNDYFSKILLDVPCSGLGVLRKKPEKLYTLTNSNLKNLRKLQRQIFHKAYSLLEKGDMILYSTCTILKEENTKNIELFLENYNDLEVQDIYIPENVIYEKDIYNGVYISHKNKYLDGFYMIKLKKI